MAVKPPTPPVAPPAPAVPPAPDTEPTGDASTYDPLGDDVSDPEDDADLKIPSEGVEEEEPEEEEAPEEEAPEETPEEAPSPQTVKQLVGLVATLADQVKSLTATVQELRQSPYRIPEELTKLPDTPPEMDPLDPEKARAYLDYEMRKRLGEMDRHMREQTAKAEVERTNLEFIQSHPDAKEHGKEILEYMKTRGLGEHQLETAYWAVVGPKIRAAQDTITKERDETKARLRKAGLATERPNPVKNAVPKPPPDFDRWPASKQARWYEANGVEASEKGRW